MKQEMILKEDTRINVISISDKKNGNMFVSHDLNMTLGEYMERSNKIPNITNTKMEHLSSFDGVTSKGGKFICGLYRHFGDDVDIIVGIIE